MQSAPGWIGKDFNRMQEFAIANGDSPAAWIMTGNVALKMQQFMQGHKQHKHVCDPNHHLCGGEETLCGKQLIWEKWNFRVGKQ